LENADERIYSEFVLVKKQEFEALKGSDVRERGQVIIGKI
jgi:hypothetical protein